MNGTTNGTADTVIPNLFLVGAAKCGTTAMASYLGQHPEIHFSSPKEPIYFGRDLEHAWRLPDLDDYLALFDAGRDCRYVGEGTVWYLYSRTAAEEIKAFSPDAKILIMLRNPVDMLYSLHGQFLFSGNENHASFEKALAAEQRRRQGRDIPRTAHFPAGLLYSEVVRYSAQIQRYFDVFGRDNVHVMFYDDFAREPQAVYRAVLEFLGVSTEHQPDYAVVNSARSIRSITLHRWLTNPPIDIWNPGRWLPRGRLSHGLQWRAQHLRGRLYNKNVTQTKRPPMTPETKRRLKGMIGGEVENLGRLLGRDLGVWV
ncbi:MAG: sulfotransferase [Kiloniellaceae bacterium]